MSNQRKLNGRMPQKPTMCEVSTLVPKSTHDMLRACSVQTGLPVSLLVNRMIAACLAELVKEGADYERLESTDGDNPLTNAKTADAHVEYGAARWPDHPRSGV